MIAVLVLCSGQDQVKRPVVDFWFSPGLLAIAEVSPTRLNGMGLSEENQPQVILEAGHRINYRDSISKGVLAGPPGPGNSSLFPI